MRLEGLAARRRHPFDGKDVVQRDKPSAAQHLEGGTPVFQMLRALSVRPDLQGSTRARVLSLMAQVGAQQGG